MARILLVDDEAMLLQLLRRYLERQGHHVDTAESAEVAIAAFGPHIKEFDIAITDLTLPGMNGEALLRELRASHLSLPGLIASGYPFESQLKGVEFLQKPFLPKMLEEAIAKILKR